MLRQGSTDYFLRVLTRRGGLAYTFTPKRMTFEGEENKKLTQPDERAIPISPISLL